LRLEEERPQPIDRLVPVRPSTGAPPVRMIVHMADEPKNPEKPDPVEDLKKGFGLLFRAAKTAVEQLPTGNLEKVVVSGVKEVGRAIENVTDQLDRQVFGGKGTVPHPEDEKDVKKSDAPPAAEAAAPPPEHGAEKPEEAKDAEKDEASKSDSEP